MQIKRHLIELLPYKSSILLCDALLKERILLLIINLLSEMIAALRDYYEYNKFLYFDPHVGENLCQIRACQLLDFYYQKEDKTNSDDMFFQAELVHCDAALQSAQTLLVSKVWSLDESKTLYDFLEKYALNIHISAETSYLMISHLLTKHRIFNENENTIINYESLISDLDISKNLARRIIHQYQKYLSEISCEFIFKHVTTCSLLGVVIKPETLELLHYLDDDSRHTLPCYVVMAVLLDYLKLRKTNILLVIRNESNTLCPLTTILYVFDSKLDRYVENKKITLEEQIKPAFIISGVSTLMDELYTTLQNISLDIFIMANMAWHPQYSGKKLVAFSQNPFCSLIASFNRAIAENAMELEDGFYKMRECGEALGYSDENKDLFYIRHIFFDTLEHQIKLAQLGHFYSDIHFGELA